MTSPWAQHRQKQTAGQKCKRTDSDIRQKQTAGQKCKRTDSDILDPLTSHILSDNALQKDGYRKDSECYLCAVMGKQYTGMDTKKNQNGLLQMSAMLPLEVF
jgi:hypothetical protein